MVTVIHNGSEMGQLGWDIASKQKTQNSEQHF